MNSSISSFPRSAIKDSLGVHINVDVSTYLHYALNSNDEKKLGRRSGMMLDKKM